MENQKATESTSSPNGEIHERANSKTEKTPENYLTNIRKTRNTGGEALVETIHTIN